MLAPVLVGALPSDVDRGLVVMDPQRGKKEALYATFALLMSLWIGKHLANATGRGDVIFTLIAAFQLYVPLWLVQRSGENPESHAIHTHGLLLGPIAAIRKRLVLLLRRRRRRGKKAGAVRKLLAHYGRGATFRASPFLEDIGRAALIAVVTFVPFAVAHHVWQEALGHPFRGFDEPADLRIMLLKQTFLIALPEELFYRGFVETRLERVWPTKRFLWGIPLGRTVVIASALFALGHFLGEYNPARLGPFFPAFIFSMLVRKSRSISGAVVYHGLSNAFAYFLASWYM